MSHVHCPECRFAYNVALSAGCPRCAVVRAPAPAVVVIDRSDALAEVDAALDRLAVALGRLDDDELDAVAVRLVSTEHGGTWAGILANAIAGAVLAKRGAVALPLEPEPPAPTVPTDRERALFALALALFARLAAVTRDAAARFGRLRPATRGD
jgi:hypothetical protein